MAVISRKAEALMMSAENVNEKKKESFTDELLDWIESFVFAVFVVILVFIFFFRIVLVDGPSMNPTLNNGDRLIVTHLNYTPARGDIVVLNSTGLNKTIIKRCIGIAGDTVKVDYSHNAVYVNGDKVDEYYLDVNEPMELKSYFDGAYYTDDNCYEYTVPEGCIFVMGDNRNNSTDSRASAVGFVNTEDILGKAVFRIMPFNSFGKVE